MHLCGFSPLCNCVCVFKIWVLLNDLSQVPHLCCFWQVCSCEWCSNVPVNKLHLAQRLQYTSVCIVVCRQIEFKFGQNHFFKKCEDRGARGATILPLKVPMSRRTFVEKKLTKINLYPGYTSSEVCQKHLKMTSFWLSNFVFLLGSQVDLCKLFYEVCFAHNGLVYWWT